MYVRIGIVLLTVVCTPLLADQPDTKPQDTNQDSASNDSPPKFELTEDVQKVVEPLFASIANADVSRSTVEMLTDSLVGGTVIESRKSTFQIASRKPDQYTIYLKEPDQRTRAYCDGESMIVALAPDAYIRMDKAVSMQDAVTDFPVPMGPYTEPLLALTLAGVDPAISFISGMRSIEIVDRDDFRGKVPAIHLKGVQADAVTWDFWISAGKAPKPLRLLVDLTPMLMASDEISVPDNFSYQVRYDFLSWRVTGGLGEGLFSYTPAEDAKEFDSLEDYFASIAGVVSEHPLLGQPAPEFQAVTVEGKKVTPKDLSGKVVVLDFWATWCAPCKAAIPVLKEVTDKFAKKGVLLLALNTGEEKSKITAYLEEQNLELNVLLDPDKEIADAFSADALPMTIVIGKNGVVESVHTGFLGEEALKRRLSDELEVLSIGGRIASSEEE